MPSADGSFIIRLINNVLQFSTNRQIKKYLQKKREISAKGANSAHLPNTFAPIGGLPPTDLTLDTEVQVLKIGDIVLVGLPSEVYVEYGLEIKRRSRSPDGCCTSPDSDG